MRTRKQLKSIFGVAIIAVQLSIMSCDVGNNPSALVGHWLHESGGTDKKPNDIELFKDGTGVCDGGSISWKVENKRFIIQSSSFGMASDYEVLDYKLTLSDNGVKSTYVNVNKDYLQKGNFIDSRDKKKYGTIKIGSQTWMSENLNYEPENSKCNHNDPNCDTDIGFYDWKTALNACPKGWHLPSNDEWRTLVDFTDGEKMAGKNLKARSGWYGNGNGTDVFGFSALPGDSGEGACGAWWTATEDKEDTSRAYCWVMCNSFVDNSSMGKISRMSIRCVQD
ncbi:MAG: fibrobacter succinogenes major paralogous domain-containing protein [Fibromonadales bacterium]|nr:fibrobacter succinogenes major paralogous domain-containing protein [Fibromonadales bacterium]